MPAHPPPVAAVFEALGFALFVREDSGGLRLATDPPPWLRRLWPRATAAGDELPLADASPFLENFLIDAEECWASGEPGRRACSGPWIEHNADGAEVQLEAVALVADGRAALVIEKLGAEFEAQKAVLQKARENVIAHQRLNAEMQKKEILLHCIADDMSGALGNVITSLRLIEREQDPIKVQRLLDLATQAAQQQQTLIHRTTEVFAQELQNLYGQEDDAAPYAEMRATIRRVLDVSRSRFLEKGVQLTAAEAGPGDPLEISADPSRLERVLANLLENALQATPAGGEVTVRIKEENESARVSIEDAGVSAPPDPGEDFTAKLEGAPGQSADAGLRLHYCQMAIENCHGEIGYEAREGGGNRYWFRLPKFHSQA